MGGNNHRAGTAVAGRHPPGLEPFENELRKSCGFPDLSRFIIRAADADANEAIASKHEKAARRTARPESFFAKVRNFPRRHFLLAVRGLAFLQLFWRKHFLPGLFRVQSARLVALLCDLQADGINERGQRKETLGGSQFPFGCLGAFRAFNGFALDRRNLLARQQ